MNDSNVQVPITSTIGVLLSYLGYNLSITEIQSILSLVSTIVGIVITITSAVIIPVYKKIKKAKEDKHITTDELEDIIDTAKKGIDEVNKEINKHE